HLERLTYPYGFTLTAEDVRSIAALRNLKEIELGFVGVSSESVRVEGDMHQWSQLRRLERIHLSKDEIADDDLAFLA
ncbi:hypothetical protein DF186_25920, partial [Enterococcus hirae]